MTPVLTMRGVSMSFGGIRAVSEVSCDVEEGEHFGIIGPNGAGKTTLLNCVNRVHRNYLGEVTVHGQSTAGRRADELLVMGVARTFQGAEYFSELTVSDYLMVGRHRHQDGSLVRSALALPRTRRIEASERRTLEELADRHGLGGSLHRPLRELSYGTRKLVDLVRALATGATLLLLDEPTSGTASEDRRALVQLLETTREARTTVVLVDHDISFVSRLCTRLLVMNYGEVLAVGPTREVLARQEVIEAYAGET